MNKVVSYYNESFDRKNYTEIIFDFNVCVNQNSINYILKNNIGLPMELNKIIAKYMIIIDNTKIAINILYCNKFPFNFPHYPPEIVLSHIKSNILSENKLLDILVNLNKNIHSNWIINSNNNFKKIVDKLNLIILDNINEKNT